MQWDFDPATRQHLQRDGWRFKRNVDIAAIEAAWSKDGYTVFSAARRFARSFAGLTLRCPVDGGGYREMELDPIVATRRLDPAAIPDCYEAAAGVRLLPVGMAHSGNVTVMAGDDGGFYAAADSMFWRMGERLETTLAAFYLNQRFVRVPLNS